MAKEVKVYPQRIKKQMQSILQMSKTEMIEALKDNPDMATRIAIAHILKDACSPDAKELTVISKITGDLTEQKEIKVSGNLAEMLNEISSTEEF